MISEAPAWLIWFLPLISFILIAFVIRPYNGSTARLSGYITVLSIAGSFVLSIWALASVIDSPGHVIEFPSHTWVEIGSLSIRMGLMMDSLTAVMVVVVSGVSLFIQIYSQGYMRDDPSYSRFFAYMSLFTASMLGLVTADNLIMLYVFWELVGLSSYLLIGFWYQRPAAAAAAKKAFIMTRFGDLGFLIAILGVFLMVGTFDIAELHFLVEDGVLKGVALTWIALGIFAGAVGKSGQFPLHTWLPDAMEGPTPVSALIHAATMVAAGVFLVARFFPLFEASSSAMTTVAYIGGGTALFAATMGLVMNDIKRVLAYSTISQLGFMMLALGVGAPAAALFHLFNHAFFKALLFLGSGSVNHTTGTFDMRLMGGLYRVMPWTFITFLIAALSLSGIPPFSGFWSKDAILLSAWHDDKILYGLGVAASFLTAVYIFRVVFMTFTGEYRGGAQEEHGSHGEQGHALHESPAVMIVPLVVLAVAAVASGLANMPGFSILGIPEDWMADFLGEAGEVFSVNVATTSSIAAGAGFLVAFIIYGRKLIPADTIGRIFRPIYLILSRKYYFDDLYEDIIITRGLYKGLSGFGDLFDRYVVDMMVNTVGSIGRNMGGVMARVQTGQMQVYGMVVSIGILVILAAFLIFGGV